MKIGQKYKSMAYGWGVISKITEDYFEVKYYSRTERYPINNTKTIEIICWIISALFIATLIYFTI